MLLNTRALSSTQDYLSPPNKEGDIDAHRGIELVKLNQMFGKDKYRRK